MSTCRIFSHSSKQFIPHSVKFSTLTQILRQSTNIGDIGASAVVSKVLEPAAQMPLKEPTGQLQENFASKVTGTGSGIDTKSEVVSSALSSGSTSSSSHFPEIGKSLTVDARRVDPATIKQVYYFNSLGLSRNLESKGFSRQQAESIAEALIEVINTTLDHQGRHMVSKSQQEVTVQQLMAEIVSVKKDMVLLQKSEFSQLRSETEKMGIELSNLKSALKDEVSKLKSHVTLDINLERGRSLEANAANEHRLQQLHNKIDTDIANLKTVFEQYRNDIFKYAGGTVLTCATICLGFLRLWH